MLSKAEKVDPRVLRTRKLLIDAFISLQAEKVFDDITIQDITMRATVNRATFYAHFPDKYALLEETIREGFARTLEQRLQTPDAAHVDSMKRLFLAITDYLAALQTQCERSYQMFESLVEAQITAQVRGQMHCWLAAQPQLSACAQSRLDLAATLMSCSLYGAALEWRNRNNLLSAEAFAAEALPLITAMVYAIDR